MRVNIPSQFILFTIHFYGEKPKNYIFQNERVYSVAKNGKLFYQFIKYFINQHIYYIFDPETIGEITYERIGTTEYHSLKNYVPSFERISKEQSPNAQRDVRENYIFSSKLNSQK